MIGLRLYTLVWYLALPFILARLVWRSVKAPGYRQHIPERLGFITPIKPPNLACGFMRCL